MRKLLTILIFIAMSMITTSKADAQTQYTVTAIKSARAIFNGGSAYLPAVVRAQAGPVAVLRTAALTIPPIRGGSLAAALAFAGLTYGADKLFDYLTDNGFPTDPTTHIPLKPVPGTYDFDQTVKDCIGVGNDVVVKQQPEPLIAEFPCSGGTTPRYGSWGNYKSCSGVMIMRSQAECQGCCSKPEYDAFAPAATPDAVGSTTSPTLQPATQQDIADVITTGLTNDDPAAKTALVDVLNRVQQALDNVNDTLNTKSQMTEIKQTLNDSVSDQTKTDLDDQLTDPDAEQNYLDDSISTTSTDSGSNLTKEDVKDAVKNALDDTTGVSVPVDPTFETPQKLSLTSILQTWMQSINSLPIMNTLNGITITASGSPIVCINLPAKYGGSICWDVSACQDTFNMIGTALLSMVSIMSFIYIFRG